MTDVPESELRMRSESPSDGDAMGSVRQKSPRYLAVNPTAVITARYGRGWNQEELAKESGVDRKTIYKAESGGNLLPRTAKRIADALGVEVSQLLAIETKHVLRIRFASRCLAEKEQVLDWLDTHFPNRYEVIDVYEGSLVIEVSVDSATASELSEAIGRGDLSEFGSVVCSFPGTIVSTPPASTEDSLFALHRAPVAFENLGVERDRILGWLKERFPDQHIVVEEGGTVRVAVDPKAATELFDALAKGDFGDISSAPTDSKPAKLQAVMHVCPWQFSEMSDAQKEKFVSWLNEAIAGRDIVVEDADISSGFSLDPNVAKELFERISKGALGPVEGVNVRIEESSIHPAVGDALRVLRGFAKALEWTVCNAIERNENDKLESMADGKSTVEQKVVDGFVAASALLETRLSDQRVADINRELRAVAQRYIACAEAAMNSLDENRSQVKPLVEQDLKEIRDDVVRLLVIVLDHPQMPGT